MHAASSKDILAIVIIIIFFFYTIFLYIKYNLPGGSYIRNRVGRYFLRTRLQPVYKPIIVKYFPVYNYLNDDDKELFERRVQKFINMKTFVGRGEIKQITPEMKALIAGAAIQITMGYPAVYFSHFRTIIIYPEAYYSRLTRQYHNGEVNQLGVIVLSWKSFMEGFRIPRDGVNLAYHEMAHALRIQNIVNNCEYNFYNEALIKEFENEARNEVIKVNDIKSNNGFFRDYAGSNLDEFFAVAIENFIERPMDLYAYNPKIYNILTKILNFDIIKICHLNIGEKTNSD